MAKIADVQEVSLEKLRPYERNAKKHGAGQIEKLKASITEFGFLTPCLIDSEYNLIAGHGRVMAAKELGIETVPCVFIEGLTDEQRRAYILADNRLGELGEWDIDLVVGELIELDELGFDVELTGFDMPEELPEVIEDDFNESVVPDEPRTKLGDIWQLGNHRLICGDSTDVNVVERLMDGVKADMVMTDPPYGINAEKMTMGTGAKDFYRGEGWDSERPDISIALTLADNVCIWGGNYFTDILPISNDWLVWHKKNDGLSFSECELAWTNFDRNIRHISHHWGNEKKLHVTMKPVEVIAWAIQQVKERAEVIVDLFGGSGSTLIACEQLNRKCFMCELDEHYCDVIISRWETLTGREAVLING